MTRRRGGNPPHAPSTMRTFGNRAASPSPKGMSATTLTKPIRPPNHDKLVEMTHDAQRDAFEHGLKYLKTIYESTPTKTADDITWCNGRPECFHTLVHNFTNSDKNTFGIGNNPHGLTKQDMIGLINEVFGDHREMLARLTAELDILLKNKISCWEFFFGGPGLPGVCRLGYHDPANEMFDRKALQQQQEAELAKKNQ